MRISFTHVEEPNERLSFLSLMLSQYATWRRRADSDLILSTIPRSHGLIQGSLTLRWDLLPSRNPIRLQRRVTKPKHQQGTPYKRQITQFTCYSHRAEIKADKRGTARPSDSKGLLDKYATALLLRRYKEQFQQWKIRFLSNRLSIVQEKKVRSFACFLVA